MSATFICRLFSIIFQLWIVWLGFGVTINAQDIATRVTIALLPFEDQTNDPQAAHWRHTVPRMIAQPLYSIKQLRVCEAEAAEYGLRRYKLVPGQAISAEQAKMIGEIIEARRVVCGHYRREGKIWTASAQVMLVADGTMSQPMTASSDDWLTLTQQLAVKILDALKITPTDAQKKQMNERLTGSADALESYSLCYALMTDKKPYQEIERIAKQAIESDPNFAAAYVAYGVCLLNQGKLDEGRAQMERALQIKPDYDRPHLALGVLYLIENNLEKGVMHIRDAIRIRPDDTDNVIRLAEYHLTLKEYDLAVAQLQIALQLNPISAHANAQLGAIYAIKAKKELSIKALQDAVLIDPNDSGIYQITSQAYDRLGMTSLAIEHREKFLSLSRQSGFNPEFLKPFENRLQELRASLQMEYVVADEPQRYDANRLQKELRDKLTEEEFSQLHFPLDSTPALKEWALEITKNSIGELEKARALYDALAERLNAGAGGALTARQVFESWENPSVSFQCQEYARFYVASARAVGLNAYFTQVDRDHNNDVVLHACAAVFISEKLLLVDPSYRWFGVPHKKFTVSTDYEAMVLQMNQSEGLVSKRIAVKLRPDALSLFNLAGSLMNENQNDEAKQIIEQFLKINPDSWMSHYAHGALAWMDKKWDLAEKELKQSVEIYPGESTAHYHLGRVLVEKGLLSEALESFRSCLRYRPKSNIERKCRQLIALINEQLANPLLKEPLNPEEKWRMSVLHESTTIFPFYEWNPMFFAHFGLIYDNRLEPRQLEIVKLQKQAAAEPDNAYCRFRMAMLMLTNKREKDHDDALKEAEKVARRVLKLRPDDMATTLVLVCLLRGSEEANQLAKNAIKVAPNDWQSWRCISQYQNDLFLRQLFAGLENLPSHGFDARRAEEAFFLRSNSQAECLALLALVNEVGASSLKSIEVPSPTAEAIARHIGCMANLNSYKITLQNLCGIPLEDHNAIHKNNRDLMGKAVLLSQDNPEMLSTLGVMLFSTTQTLAPRDQHGQVDQAAWFKTAELTLQPIYKRLLELADHRDVDVASAAYEGYCSIANAQQGFGMPVTPSEEATVRLEKACAQSPHRVLLWDLRLFRKALQAKEQTNNNDWKVLYPIAVARSNVIASSRSHALLAATAFDPEVGIPQWEKAIALEPENLFYSLYLVSAMMRADTSEKTLTKALTMLQEIGDRGYENGYWKEFPQHNNYRLRLFAIQQALSGKTKVAERTITQLLETDPSDQYAIRLRKAIDEKP